MPSFRIDRRHGSREDQRDPAQKDRDRILHTSALRGLAGITQVVSPQEGHIFYHRLTHSLEVAQVARRLSERILKDAPDLAAFRGPTTEPRRRSAHSNGTSQTASQSVVLVGVLPGRPCQVSLPRA